MYDELTTEFCKILVVSKMRVVSTTQKIFLCGGESCDINKKNNFLSARDYFHKTIINEEPELAANVICAESLNQWVGDNHYNNLLDLEEDLADLVSLIPIFVESPGSLAELGAFSVIPEIRSKMLVFLDVKYSNKKTFIWLGPLKKLDKEKIKTYEFPDKKRKKYFKKEDFKKFSHFVIEDIINKSKNKRLNRKFNEKDIAHLVLLICDIVSIMVISKKSDISAFLGKLELRLDDSVSLKKCLWIADKMGLIRITNTYGADFYSISLNNHSNYLEFSYIEGTKNEMKDRAKWRARFMEKINHDPRYKSAYEEVKND